MSGLQGQGLDYLVGFGHVVVIATWRIVLGFRVLKPCAKLNRECLPLNREPDEGSAVVPDSSVVADVRDDR